MIGSLDINNVGNASGAVSIKDMFDGYAGAFSVMTLLSIILILSPS